MLIARSTFIIITLLHLGAKLGFLPASVSAYRQPRQHSSRHRLVDNTDYDFDNDCVIQPLTERSYVSAIYRTPTSSNVTSVADCNGSSASESSLSDREIHVIRLVAPPMPAAGQPEAEFPRNQRGRQFQSGGVHTANRIRVQVQPEVPGSLSVRDVVVVLAAPFPVTWQVVSQRMPTDCRVNFWVLNESRVIRDDTLDMRVRRFSLNSTELGNLAAWIQRRLGPVTTLNEIRLPTNIVAVTVSRRAVSDNDCEHQLANQSSVVQKIQGCVARWNEDFNGKHVHIIDLHNAPSPPMANVSSSSSGSVPVVEVDIHPRSRQRSASEGAPVSRSSNGRWRHLILVLKLRRGAALWTIRTSGLRGNVDIVTDQAVNTNDIDVQRVRVVTERLNALSGYRLIEWTTDKYGPPVSYSEIKSAANFFDITVDGGVNLPRTPDRNQQVNPVDSEEDEGEGEGEEEESEQEAPPSVVSPGINPQITELIRRAQHVDCRPDRVFVALDKHVLQQYGTVGEMSLMDQHCRPNSNSTHYFWSVKLTECGMLQGRHVDRITYENVILLHMLLPATTEQNPAVNRDADAVDGGVGGRRLHSNSVLSDGSQIVKTGLNEFRCDYPVTAPSSQSVSVGANSFRLRLFADAKFSSEVRSFPAAVVEKQTLYVEASKTASDSSLQVVIENCSLVDGSHPQDSSSDGGGRRRVHYLIRRGCLSDKSARWQSSRVESDNHGRQRFKFGVEKYWSGDLSLSLTLQCHVVLCRHTIDGPASIPLCIVSEGSCRNTAVDGSTSRLQQSVKLTLGPLMVQPDLVDISSVSTVPDLLLRSADQSQGSRASSSLSTSPSSSAGILSRESSSSSTVNASDVATLSSAASQGKCVPVVRVDGVDATAVVCIAFAAFAIGVLLMSGIWYIHVHTGKPRKRRPAGQRSLDASSASTPCSNAPITIHQVHQA